MELFVTDLDGTLLNSHKEVSIKSIEILNKLIDDGVNFTVATARTPATVVDLLQDVNLKLPAVLMNGVLLYDIKEEKYINIKEIEKDTVDKVFDILNKFDKNAMVYGIRNNHLWVYHKEFEYSWEYNFYKERAMSFNECLEAIFTGIDLINEKSKDYDVFSNGEMGIANTTTSSALLYSVTRKNIDEVVGRGGGLSDEGLNKKKRIIVEACERYNTFEMDAIEMLAAVGGFDLACMLGMYIGAALNKKLMLVDGFISSVAALLACSLNKNVQDYLLFTHKSEEPGVNIILDYLKEKTFLNMNMRLGEGTGAVLAYPIIDCAIEMINTMKSPEEVYNLFYK